MQGSYVVAVALLAPHCVNSGARYLVLGIVGLESHRRSPKHSPSTKTGASEIALALELRFLRNLGKRRIQSELKRLHSISRAMAWLHAKIRLNSLLSFDEKLTSFTMNIPFLVIVPRSIPAKLVPIYISTQL